MRILTIILLLFVCNFSFSQTFINRAGPANTVIDARLGAAQNFYLPRLIDTTLSGGKDSIGNLIYDRLRAKIWIRDTILLGGHKFTQLFKQDDTISTLATQYDLTAKQDVLLSDVYRLPQLTQYYPAQGITNSGATVANYPISALDSSIYYFTTSSPFGSGTKFGGVLWSTPIGDSAQLSAPFGVLAGSSFVEGHRLLHGRLHPNGVGTFTWNYPDSVGQMSYHLRQLTNYRWYNHGIGGQTSSQLRFRWCRDVLAQTCDPNDGRGTKTLSRLPWIVIFDGCGNDPYGVGMTPAISIANLEYFAKSCQDNNMRFIVCNSPAGPPASVTTAGVKYLETVNKFLESGGLDKYGAIVFDLKSYWSDPAFGYDGLHGNPNLIDPVDGVHFIKAGYDSLSNAIFNTCKIPVLTKIAFTNKLAPTNPFLGLAQKISEAFLSL